MKSRSRAFVGASLLAIGSIDIPWKSIASKPAPTVLVRWTLLVGLPAFPNLPGNLPCKH
jgi:hypothetical protein